MVDVWKASFLSHAIPPNLLSMTMVPEIFPFGIDAALIRFSTEMSEAANRAALSFAGTLRSGKLPFVEVTTTLASVVVRFDPLVVSYSEIEARLIESLSNRDWDHGKLPAGRKLWRIPTLYGGEAGPQLAEAAALAGESEDAAIEVLGSTRMRVLTIGFAPGFPYLGSLPPNWDLSRQKTLTPRVPAGALGVAIRQLVVFPNPSPTGWRWIGQTAVSLFDTTRAAPSLLSAADEVVFAPVSEQEFTAARTMLNGGATSELIA